MPRKELDLVRGGKMGEKRKQRIKNLWMIGCIQNERQRGAIIFQRENHRKMTEENEVACFVGKTYEILSNEEFSKVIYWAPTGREFIIRDINKFEEVVLPQYFRHQKINSFVRQLNMYGFHKSRKENSKSVFSHPLFQRGRTDLLREIKRKCRQSMPIGKLTEKFHKTQTPSSSLTSFQTIKIWRSFGNSEKLTLSIANIEFSSVDDSEASFGILLDTPQKSIPVFDNPSSYFL